MLTRKQHELLMFIHERIKESGVSPSFDEMKEALDLASKSGIHRLITALEERGFLRRLAHRARALEVVRLPEDATPGAARAPFKPQLVEARSSASFISSKDGETPDSLIRSWMNMRSSCCFRVSISDLGTNRKRLGMFSMRSSLMSS